jgi:DNA-binding CsgD family transcriptional regulator/type II secretory pathway predicted ATPase ExeA
LADHPTLQSPVLVGREEFLALAGRRLAAAADGQGYLLFVAGEAGIGKTRLLAAIAGAATGRSFGVVRAAAFPGDTEASGGLLLDLASDLRQSREARLREAGEAMSARLRELAGVGGDRHRQRRLLVQDLADAAGAVGAGEPVLVVLEDLHWADQLSLEVVAHLATRLAGRPLLVVGAYRSDELYPRLPIRAWRARLLTQRLAEEIRLPRLTRDQTTALTGALLGHAPPARVVDAVHDRSDGIPLHVEELLAAAGEPAAELGPGRIPAVPVPDTLADAVLARARALDPPARAVANAAAVIGRSFQLDLLVAVSQLDPEQVDHGLRRLQERFLVTAGADPASFDFRHALLRDVLYADVPLPERRRLHERVAGVAAGRGYRDAFVSAHFEQAGLAEPAHRHALAAAREAAALSAHREALALYRRAQRNLPPGPAPGEHAALLAAIGDEAAAVDDNDAALEAYEQAHRLLAGAGDRLGAAAVVARLVAVTHLLGEDLATRAGRLEQALASLPDDDHAGPVRAALLSALAAAYMLDRRLEEAIGYGERSLAVDAVGDDAASLNTAVTLGSVLVFAGRMDEGWAMLEAAIDQAAGERLEAEAARGYRMLGSSASVLVEYDRAERWLEAGVAYAERVELWNHRHYMAAHLAHVLWADGRWKLAERTASSALADGRGGITTRITAEHVLGFLAVGRGDWPQAGELLGDALRRGEAMAELQRLSPALWGLAEAALLRGDPEEAIARCDRGHEASARVGDAAYLFPFLVTGVRARLAAGRAGDAERWFDEVAGALADRSIPGTLAAVDHGRGLLELARGELQAARAALDRAAAGWRERRRFWEGTWARLDQARCALAARRVAEGTALAREARDLAAEATAATVVAEADRLLATATGGRPAAPWSPLTAREFEVARLVAAGNTNRQIAAELFLSPKTVGSHVEHILTKLGAARRAEIAAWVAALPPGAGG